MNRSTESDENLYADIQDERGFFFESVFICVHKRSGFICGYFQGKSHDLQTPQTMKIEPQIAQISQIFIRGYPPNPRPIFRTAS